MCGLVTIIGSSGYKVDPHILKAMADTISHRGPDEENMWVDGNIGFYHKRLSIIDLATGQQPMARDGVTIAFNGEIYNYVELRDELERCGESFSTTSDTEVLLVAYRRWGIESLKKLNGMFAFVIYDAAKRRVVAARDHFGIKPLYRYEGRGFVVYASEIKALLAHPQIGASLDLAGLEDYVTFQYTLGQHTFFKGISKVLPAHVEVNEVGSSTIKSSRYWEPRYEVDENMAESDAIATLRDLLQDAVRLQMRSDVPVGAYLSGGLDSSTVTALASPHSNGIFQTFSGAFREGPEYDETGYADLVAERVGSAVHKIYPGENDFVNNLPKLVYSMDEPAAGPGLFPQYMVSSVAAKNVKVCLGGQGGDEIFGGYARYPIAYFEHVLIAKINGDDHASPERITLEDMTRQLSSLRQYQPLMRRHFSRGMFDSFDRRYFALVDRSEGALDVFSKDYRAAHSKERVFARYQDLFSHPETDSLWNRMLHFDMTSSLPALLQVEDRVSMAVSLESRVPLLDYRITEFTARVPPWIKWKGGEMKYLFRKAIEPWLPKRVMSRNDKMGFPVPLQIWAKGSTKEFFCDVLLSQRCRDRGLFDAAAVRNLISNEAAFSRVLWGLLQIELWHQKFIDPA